ncbi:MAG: dTDP-4-dehydrorhamnose 3,5-epimerase [Chitinophagales bacterium]|nr:dTDP-4-dehydrorhamnose 3,5-epimerase [Chitinophagales bacterium]
MAWKKGDLEGVWLFNPNIWKDDRGYFTETFNARDLPEPLASIVFVQDNEAKSVKGVLRGLHYQLPPYAQSKLVRCIEGRILDVIVDLRPQSLTYGQHLSILLDDIDKMQIFVPHGFAHGYVVLSETAIVAYKVDNFYHPKAEGGLLYKDQSLAIDWMLPEDAFIVSDKDLKLPIFNEHRPFL